MVYIIMYFIIIDIICHLAQAIHNGSDLTGDDCL